MMMVVYTYMLCMCICMYVYIHIGSRYSDFNVCLCSPLFFCTVARAARTLLQRRIYQDQLILPLFFLFSFFLYSRKSGPHTVAATHSSRSIVEEAAMDGEEGGKTSQCANSSSRSKKADASVVRDMCV